MRRSSGFFKSTLCCFLTMVLVFEQGLAQESTTIKDLSGWAPPPPLSEESYQALTEVELFSLPSQNMRSEIQRIKSQMIGLIFHKNHLNTDDQKTLAVLSEAFNSELKTIDSSLGALFNETETANQLYLWNAYSSLYFMMIYAQRGYVEIAQKYRDYALVSVLELQGLTEKSTLEKGKKLKVRELFLFGPFEWALGAIGPAKQGVATDRVSYSINDFFIHLTHPSYFKKLKNLYVTLTYKESIVDTIIENFIKSFGAIIIGVLMGASYNHFSAETSWALSSSLSSLSIIVGTVLSFSFLFIWPMIVYFNLAHWKPFQRIKTLRNKLSQQTMETYLDYEIKARAPQKKHEISLIPRAGYQAEIQMEIPNTDVSQFLTGDLDWLNAKVPVTNCQCSSSLFRHLNEHKKDYERINQVLAQKSEMQEQILQGRNFRQSYEHQLLADFEGAQYNWIIDPETELLRLLAVTDRLNHALKIQPASVQDAEKKALDEARNQFNLPESVELSDLEDQRWVDARLGNAYTYYQRQFYYYQQEIKPNRALVSVNTDEFKNTQIKAIEAVRIQNLKSTLKRFKSMNEKVLKLKIRTQVGIQSVEIEQLLASEIQFVSASKSQLGIEAKESKVRINDSFVLKNLDLVKWNLGGDYNSFRDVYEVQPVQPLLTQNKITFKGSFGVIEMTEKQFSQLLFELGPKYYVFHSGDPALNHYQIEAARRDALLADTVAFLKEESEGDLKSLDQRLRKRINNRSRVSTLSKTFTEELRDQPELLREDSPLLAVRWFGYSLHSDFWRLRDMDAHSIEIYVKQKLPHWVQKFKEDSLGLQARLTRFRESKIRAAGVRVEKRFTDFENRQNRRIKSTLITYGIIGLIVSLAVGGMAEKGSGTDAGSKTSESRSNLSAMASDLIVAQNHPFDKEEANKASPYRIEKRFQDVVLPHYLNLPILQNLPKSLALEEQQALRGTSNRLEIDSSIEFDPTVQNEKFVRSSDWNQGVRGPLSENSWQFTIYNSIPLSAKNGFLPIPSPSESRLASFKLIDEGYGVVPTSAYTVFFDNRTGLTYARLKDTSAQWYYMIGTYRKVSALKKVEPADWTVRSTETFKNLTEELAASGATQLSHRLTSEMKEKTQINLSYLAVLFGASAVYTFDPEGWDFSYFSKNSFRSYQKFLRDGVYYYQCTGSNLLFGDFLKNYYAREGSQQQVTNLVGFVIQGENDFVNPSGHMHTLVYDQNSAYRYVELDATPGTMDPKYPKAKSLLPKTIMDEQQRLLLKNSRLTYESHDQNKGLQMNSPTSGSFGSAPHALRPRRLKPHKKSELDSLPERESMKVPESSKVPATRESFNLRVQQLQALLNSLRDKHPVLKQIGQRELLGLEVLSLIPSTQRYLAEPTAKNFQNWIQQFIRLDLQLPLSRTLTASQEALVTQHFAQGLKNANDDHEILFNTFLKRFEEIYDHKYQKLQNREKRQGAVDLFDYIDSPQLEKELKMFLNYFKTYDFQISKQFKNIKHCGESLKVAK